MKSLEMLRKQRDSLRQEIIDNLDFLMGSVSTKGPTRPGFNLTFKINQVTRTRHIRKENETRVTQMTTRWRRLRILLRRLSDTNWQLLSRDIY
jgi:hypothetical protein